MADIAGDEEGRCHMLGIQQEDVAFRLAPGVLHHHVPALRGGPAPELFWFGGKPGELGGGDLPRRVLRAGKARLLGFEDEVPAPVEVDAPGSRTAVARAQAHGALEGVVVAGGVAAGRLRSGYAEHVAELAEEHLVVRALRTALACGPAFDEALDVQTRLPPPNGRKSHPGREINLKSYTGLASEDRSPSKVPAVTENNQCFRSTC
nr:hypothetical protein [Methylobacterium sp. WL103]